MCGHGINRGFSHFPICAMWPQQQQHPVSLNIPNVMDGVDDDDANGGNSGGGGGGSYDDVVVAVVCYTCDRIQQR